MAILLVVGQASAATSQQGQRNLAAYGTRRLSEAAATMAGSTRTLSSYGSDRRLSAYGNRRLASYGTDRRLASMNNGMPRLFDESEN